VVTAAPFLPVLNTLIPLAAGVLGMPYRRYLILASVGAAMWAGLYAALGAATGLLEDLLPHAPVTTVGTVGVGMAIGWLVLLNNRRRLARPRG
jgi:membrane-associated protein